MNGTAFVGGVLAWLAAAALYSGMAYMSSWAFTDHWPIHPWWCVTAGLVGGLHYGVKAASSLRD